MPDAPKLREKTGGTCVLSLTRKTDYALAALADMARDGRGGSSARDLSERLQLPVRALTNILNHLKHRGLVLSIRGARGGYRLAKEAKEITLADLIEAVEGPVSLTRCSTPEEPDRPGCERSQVCEVSEAMQKVHATLLNCLSQVTLQDIASNNLPPALSTPASV